MNREPFSFCMYMRKNGAVSLFCSVSCAGCPDSFRDNLKADRKKRKKAMRLATASLFMIYSGNRLFSVAVFEDHGFPPAGAAGIFGQPVGFDRAGCWRDTACPASDAAVALPGDRSRFQAVRHQTRRGGESQSVHFALSGTIWLNSETVRAFYCSLSERKRSISFESVSKCA